NPDHCGFLEGGVALRSKVFSTMAVGLALSACAAQQTTWLKPGATNSDFAKDKYSCMQQSQQRVTSAFVNQYGGSSSNHEITNTNLFTACMNAQGWTLQKQATVDQAKTAFDALNSEKLAFCASEEVQPHFSKTPCKPRDTTLEQM